MNRPYILTATTIKTRLRGDKLLYLHLSALAAAERQRMQEMIEEKKKDIAQFKDAIATAQTEKEDKITVLSMEVSIR